MNFLNQIETDPGSQAQPTPNWESFRRLWRDGITPKKWKGVTMELEQLYRLPMLTRLAGRNCHRLSKKSWVDSRLEQDPMLQQLLRRLVGVFTADPHFAAICRRFGYRVEDGLEKLGIEITFPLMAFWTFRRFPCLSREIISDDLKGYFSVYKDIPLENFFAYAPLFVLYRLRSVLVNQQTAQWVHWIVSGKNLRHAPGLPFPLTRRMAHWVIHAPYKATFEEALFYGQIRGLGGNYELFGRLRPHFHAYFVYFREFREQVLRFFVKYQDQIGFNDIRYILGYLQHRYFDVEDGNTFHLDKYSYTALQRDMNEWYGLVEGYGFFELKYVGVTWPGAPFRGIEVKKGECRYRIVQLTSYEELREEGRALKHCVGAYVDSCVENSCSIWSLRRYDTEDEVTSLVTIEVNAEGEIVQALGMHNAKPIMEEMKMIRYWASVEGLGFGVLRC